MFTKSALRKSDGDAMIKSVVLLPYCPIPADTGGKVEMLKYVKALRELGDCTVLSSNCKPVGMGWSPETIKTFEDLGIRVVLRENDRPRLQMRQYIGILYASICKFLGMEKAFGHANPYHRYAFPADWWYDYTRNADLAVIHYSYWAWLPCACPKFIALLDIWSDSMWGGCKREVNELQAADKISVISLEEQKKLEERGIPDTIWSPPFVDAVSLTDNDQIGMVGSANRFNQEGLTWLSRVSDIPDMQIKLYGGLAKHATGLDGFVPVGRYANTMDPYRSCGIILMTTSLGMGVQIKGIEALAAGRAIIARRGALRGIPEEQGAWIEVDTPNEMLEAAKRLQQDKDARLRQMEAARAYYQKHLDANQLRSQLLLHYQQVASSRKRN
jgi:glycosyltransferase involved in cell wall biosynthesis